ncbi:hypothetical protein AOL_s00043g126 [Orbilia oligospora ATCC 24927]|uniref:Uncharacterized protein n=1 Tax=Arthrobotrys oligospora (strain ATCC 24927 / CBS 115.81 / DSM 1491) TaxID=756982 RepID=G1X353_ARTOA|nr:hypothetical protein AOL_s00043g126 [Orbilia oligospora ATCC 24927]EGX52337.1 hypothetical protein AOL_s00043g126 [Orbilia oligospora ATCC 24927]
MSPQQIFVGGYDDAIDSFVFDEAAGTLIKTHSTLESKPGPSWQHIIPEHRLLLSGCEGPLGEIGYLDSYRFSEDGALTKVDRKECVQGDASGVNTYYIKETGEIVPLQTLLFTLPDGQAGHPDIDPVRQDAAHPHESRIDPTGKFLLIPDLGSDYLRIFEITYGEKGEDSRIKEVEPLVCDTRAGPRHCYFDRTGKFMYLVEELASMVRVYQVEYTGPRGIDFKPIQRISSLGIGKGPADTRVQRLKAAEVAISPDDKHLYISNRYDRSMPDGTDSIAHFLINTDDGTLTFVELTSAGGINPRHIRLSPDGSWICIATQDTNRVAMFKRDLETGTILEEVVAEGQSGQPVCITW